VAQRRGDVLTVAPSSKRRLGAALAVLALLVTSADDASAEPPAASAGPGDAPNADRAPPPPPPADAADKPIVVWPTLTPAGDDPGQAPLHRPAPTEGAVAARAQELDATLRDAVQDLGFTLDVADQGPTMARARDLDLIERAAKSTVRGGETDPGTWVLSARLEPAGGDTFLLRILAVPPKSKQLRVRVEKVSGADVSVRGLVMLRDLLSAAPGHAGEVGPRPQESASTGVMSTLRSQGRAVLAVNAALFGAFTAYSVQRASGSEDPRLLYPLLTLGTGIGLGGALLVAEEWNVGTGDAWTLASSAWWGAAAGIAIANGRHVQPLTDRYAWGVGGGLIGLSLATFSLTRGKADEGDAVLVNSGAAVGLGFGALGDFFYAGDIESRTPYTGAGYGTALGLVAGGTLATFVQVSPSRVLLVDLGVGLGAATGAALASPLVFEDLTPTKTRGFLAATAGGMLAGGTVAWLLTRDKPAKATTSGKAEPHVVPYGGVVGSSATREGNVPAYGAGVRGTW
jgi:hypothetical protein